MPENKWQRQADMANEKKMRGRNAKKLRAKNKISK
mgnify:CR=1 FL=1